MPKQTNIEGFSWRRSTVGELAPIIVSSFSLVLSIAVILAVLFGACR